MTCAELRERAVDPASALQGGHATVVEHLESCADCRWVMRSFGAIDRLLRTTTPVETPAADLDRRARALLVTPQPGRAGLLRSPAVVAGLVGVVLVAVLVFSRRSRVPGADSQMPASGEPRATAEAGPASPAILTVESTPIVVNAPPLTEAEESEALKLWDLDFLTWCETLAGLGPFFPSAIGPVPADASGAAPSDARPPISPDGVARRSLEWRSTPKAQRARLIATNQSLLARPEAERLVLEERWTTVAAFTDEERAGLRRLAGRMAELDPKSARRLESDVRTIGLAPREERQARWRALPFAQTLTGQEQAIAERLLLSR